MTVETMLKIFPSIKKNTFTDVKNKSEKYLELDDKLASIMADDWKTLDEAEKAEAVASIKRIIKQRTPLPEPEAKTKRVA